jgi:endo-1,4-beta-D-glucanase Y
LTRAASTLTPKQCRTVRWLVNNRNTIKNQSLETETGTKKQETITGKRIFALPVFLFRIMLIVVNDDAQQILRNRNKNTVARKKNP